MDLMRLMTPGRPLFAVLVGSHPQREALLDLTAALAFAGPVHVLDAGNHFDPIRIAYRIRAHTPDLMTYADRIRMVRAFTCVEVLRALQAQEAGAPLIIMDMLATFYDQAVSHRRSGLLVAECLQEIRRLKAPVLASVRNDQPADGPRAHLLQALADAADLVDEPSARLAAPAELRLF